MSPTPATSALAAILPEQPIATREPLLAPPFEVLTNEWYAYNAPRWAQATRYKVKLYLEQRRDMVQAWADSVDALCAGANVVSIKRKA